MPVSEICASFSVNLFIAGADGAPGGSLSNTRGECVLSPTKSRLSSWFATPSSSASVIILKIYCLASVRYVQKISFWREHSVSAFRTNYRQFRFQLGFRFAGESVKANLSQFPRRPLPNHKFGGG